MIDNPDLQDFGLSELLTKESFPASKSKPEPVPTESPIVWPEPTHKWEIPENAIYGDWIKRTILKCESPPSLAYLSALTIHAGQGINLDDDDPHPRPALYTLIFAPPKKGKGQSTKRMIHALNARDDVKVSIAASSEALAYMFPAKERVEKEMVDVSLRARTLYVEEFEDQMARTQYQGSTLAQTFCTLWENDYQAIANAKGEREIKIRLSILGCLPAENLEDFHDAFAAKSTTGLYDRFLFAPGPTDWPWDPAKRWYVRPETRRPHTVNLPDSARVLSSAWLKASTEDRGRLLNLAMRVAILSASLNGEEIVTDECMQAALRFMEWQERVRAGYTASKARNDSAKLATAILEALQEHGVDENGEHRWVRLRELNRMYNWSRKYGSSVTQVRLSLEADQLIRAKYQTDAEGHKTKTWTGLVRLWSPKDDDDAKLGVL